MGLQLLPLIAVGGLVRTAVIRIAGWFGAGGAVSTFFTWIGVKLTTKAFAIAFQIATMVALFVARVAFGYAVYNIGTKLYNYFNSFMNIINSFFHSDGFLTLAYQILTAIGFIDAFKDAFDIFNICLPAIGVAYLAKFAFKTLEVTSNEYFKLSVLLQQ